MYKILMKIERVLYYYIFRHFVNLFYWTPRILKEKIKSLIYWLPIIWNDRGDDHAYFYKILIHKLISMKYYFESDSICEKGEKIESIKKCIKLLKRLERESYLLIVDRYSKKDTNGLWEKEQELYNKDLDELFRIMKENVRTWWD
jgi:hypothetical protein